MIDNPLSAERIARDGPRWADKTIAQGAWEKAATQPDDVAIYMEGAPALTYGAASQMLAALG